MSDFIFFCKSINKYTGSVASIFLFFERLVPIFLSNHFMIHRRCGLSVNNVPFDFSSSSKSAFLYVGDIIDIGSVVSANCKSVFAPLFVLFFNVLLSCCNAFFSDRLFFALVYKLYDFMFVRKGIIRCIHRIRAPLVRAYALGSAIVKKSVSYFIRSRSSTQTHLRSARSASTTFDFGSFVTTVVTTNKEYTAMFLETQVTGGLNGFWNAVCTSKRLRYLNRCSIYYHVAKNALYSRYNISNIFLSGRISTSINNSRQSVKSNVLPVFFYTFFTRFV